MAELPSLEELFDAATDDSATSSNHDRALFFADGVNKNIGGSHTAVKLMISKLQLRQETITLQTLNVAECCVKNCGESFHKEIGKYKFINELIKLLSPKYDAAITPQSVKDRVTELLYAWYCGLPREKKIAEAYKMLKQQGIITKDPVGLKDDADDQRKPENTVFEDEANSQLLSALLSSQDPEDLQSANKLIKSLVQQEEQRLDRVSKRIQELETVNNNVRLLDEMLTNVTNQSMQADKEIMHELYETCLKLRPELFRLASRSVEDKDDAMDEILGASDELTRVIDLYKEKVLLKKIDAGHEKPYNIQQPVNGSMDSSNTSMLLDLDIPSNNTSSQVTPNEFMQTSTGGNTLLEEQFKMLGLDAIDTSTSSTHQSQVQTQPLNTQNFPSQNVGSSFSINPMTSQSNALPYQQNNAFYQPPITRPAASAGFTTANQGFVGAVRPNADYKSTPSPSNNTVSANTTTATGVVKSRKDVLDFDIFSQFKPEDFKKPTPTNVTSNAGLASTDGVNQTGFQHLIDVSNDNSQTLQPSSKLAESNNFTKTGGNIDSLLDISFSTPDPTNSLSSTTNIQQNYPDNPVTSITSQNTQINSNINTHQPPPLTNIPNIVNDKTVNNQDNYLVPLEALKPDGYEPLVLLDKNNIKSFLNIANDTRPDANKNVIVTILSTISTNVSAVNEFTIQVAVPKTMRVKLQPATSNVLQSFNPILPPSSINQIMLIANPTKEPIRLRFKITYSINGVQHVENSSINQFPIR